MPSAPTSVGHRARIEKTKMAKKIDHSEINAKKRGRRDHDYEADAKRKKESEKREHARWKARVDAGKRSRSKVAKRSGPVRFIEGEERRQIIDRLRAEGVID